MTDLDSVDFFTDNELLADPYDYLAALREECPLRREKHHDVVMVIARSHSHILAPSLSAMAFETRGLPPAAGTAPLPSP
jgi:hypothetical protein